MKTGIPFIVIGAILAVLGAIVVPAGIVATLIFGERDREQFVVPGETRIMAEEPGRYYLWNDYQTICEGRTYHRTERIPDGLQIRIFDQQTGERHDFVSNPSISVSSGQSSRNSIGYIQVRDPGELRIEISGVAEERIFSFSRSVLAHMLWMIVGGISLSLLVGFTGLGLIVWGVVKLVKQPTPV